MGRGGAGPAGGGRRGNTRTLQIQIKQEHIKQNMVDSSYPEPTFSNVLAQDVDAFQQGQTLPIKLALGSRKTLGSIDAMATICCFEWNL